VGTDLTALLDLSPTLSGGCRIALLPSLLTMTFVCDVSSIKALLQSPESALGTLGKGDGSPFLGTFCGASCGEAMTAFVRDATVACGEEGLFQVGPATTTTTTSPALPPMSAGTVGALLQVVRPGVCLQVDGAYCIQQEAARALAAPAVEGEVASQSLSAILALFLGSGVTDSPCVQAQVAAVQGPLATYGSNALVQAVLSAMPAAPQ
jgi:hypothetical protein